MRRTLALLLAGLCSAAAATAQTLPIVNSRITGLAEVKSGGELEIESGATLDVQSGATVTFGAPLSLANGGLGVALTDPAADRLLFWDDSGSAVNWLTIGSGLSLSGTSLSAVGDVASTDIDSSAKLAALITDETGSGALVFSDSPTITTLTLSGAVQWPSDTRQTFAPGATSAGVNVGGVSGDPSSLSDGDLWYDTDEAQLMARIDGVSVPLGASEGAPTDATYIVQTASSGLSNEQSLALMPTGLLKVTNGTGVLSGAEAGTDFVEPGAVTSSGITMSSARLLGRSSASAGAIEEITVGTGLSLSSGTLTATGGGGGPTSKTLVRWTAAGNQPPSSAFATLDTRNSILVLDFDDATDESAVFLGSIPEGTSLESGIRVVIYWMSTTATTGSVVWTSAFMSLYDLSTDMDSDSFATAVSSGAIGVPTTSGYVRRTEIDHSSSEIDGLNEVVMGETESRLFRMRISRDADDAGDTASGDAEIIAVEIWSR